MDGGLLTLVARSTVSGAFLLTATWKLRNPRSFRAAYASAVPRVLRRYERLVGKTLPFAEGCLALLLLSPRLVAFPATLAAILMLVAFTWTLLRMDLQSGCGCWQPSAIEPTKRSLVIRNCFLMLACLGAMWPVAPLPLAHAWFAVMLGFVLSVLVLELPIVATVALETERAHRP